MSVLVVHLSDAHLKSNSDPLIARLPNLARAIGSEFNASVKAILIAFTGDAVDKGSILAFEVAKSFFTRLREEVQTITACITHILMIPGNHDVVQPSDPALRDLAIANLTKGEMSTRPQASFEQVVLDPLNRYFELAKACDASSPTPENPYYVTVDKTYEGHTIRVHLLNTAWMCTRGQHPGDLLFPLDELGNVPHANSVDYELSLLHHPFHWFKQPEIMRNLREKIESRSDMILTGHEHVGRSLVQKTFGKGENEYHEGEALQDGDAEVRSGFHVLKIDFENDRQILSTYLWKEANGIGAYHHENNLFDAPLTRNDSKITLINRFKHSFEVMLSDPELPIQHPKNGKLTLGEFFTYPDVKLKDDGDEIQKPRIKGGDVLGIVVSQKRSLFLGPDRCGKSSFAKRLCFDLHACGHLPLFVSGETLAHAKSVRKI